jgi:hypothetical protein
MSRIILIGCGKQKASEKCAAAEMYTGSMFRARARYATGTGDPVYIISAKHGLVGLTTVIEPYDWTIGDLSPLNQIAWGIGVAGQICEMIDNDSLTLRELRNVNFEFHAGADYVERLQPVLIAAGFSTSWPVQGISQGAQLRWYKNRMKVIE